MCDVIHVFRVFDHSLAVPAAGIEPTSVGLQPSAFSQKTRLAYVVSAVGFEPTTFGA